MMKSISFVIVALLICAALSLRAQEISTLKFDDLHQRITQSSEEPLVVNFWATWCLPCIEELPYFEQLQQEYKDNGVKVLLVSLDMQKDAVEKFRDKKNMTTEIVYLNETDFNAWIDKISPDWSGALPATLLVNNSTQQKVFMEGQLEREKLYEQVQKLMN